MFSRIFLYIRLQLWRAHNFDIICESAVEPADSGIIINSGLQNPIRTLFRDVLGSKRVLLQQQVLLDFYASKMQAGIDKYWDENNMGEEDINAILNEHMRTPYPQGK
mgnify:CR=1 FL=1